MSQWHYEDNGQSSGPVEAEEIQRLAAEGRITAATRLWTAGQDGWKTAAELGLRPTALNEGVVCSECGKLTARDAAIPLGTAWACAACKSVALQRVMSGSAPHNPLASLWQDGRFVLMHREADLGDSCIKCGEAAGGRKLKRQLYWHHPAWYLLVLANLIIYLIVAIAIRKRATLHVPLCERHFGRRRLFIGTAWALLLLSVGSFVLSAVAGDAAMPALIGLGFLSIFASIATAIVAAWIVRPGRIDDSFVRFLGAKPPYLDRLPQWTGPK